MDQAVGGDVERPRGRERGAAEDAPLQPREAQDVGEDVAGDFAVEIALVPGHGVPSLAMSPFSLATSIPRLAKDVSTAGR